jgi:rubrerythrin
MMQGDVNTGTKDVTYNLVSVLYHALQGAENYAIYSRDAEQSGDSETAGFFKECMEQETRRADRAKKLLAKRLNAG